MQKLGSRKLWLALVALAYVVVQVLLGGVSPQEGIEAVTKVALGYLGAQGLTDAAEKWKA